jgi:hypothetical protein
MDATEPFAQTVPGHRPADASHNYPRVLVAYGLAARQSPRITST